MRINYEVVFQVANKFRQKSSDSQSMLNELSNSVKGMEAEFEGMAAQRFYGDFVQWQQEMNKHVEMLNGIGAELDRIGNTIKSAEEQASRR